MTLQEILYHSALLSHQSVQLILVLCAVYLVLESISTIRLWLQRCRLVREYGCQPVAHSVGSWPLGLNAILEEKRANEANDLPTLMDERFNKYGHTLGISGLRHMKYITCEPRIVQTVLSTHFGNFPKRPLITVASTFLGDHSIFMLDGPKWEHARAMLKPQFARDQVADFTDLEKHVERFLTRAYPFPLTNAEIKGESKQVAFTTDIQPLIFDLLFDSVTENLLGESADTQLRKEAGLADDVIAFENAVELAAQVAAIQVGLGKLYSWLEMNIKYSQACKTNFEYVRPYVEKALHLHSMKMRAAHTLANGGKETSKAKKWVALNELAAVDEDLTQSKAFKDALASHAISLLVAGRDTTSAMLSWAIHLLARNPQVYSKLRQEILKAFNKDNGSMQLPDYPTLKALPYVRWVLKETLRLYPVVTVNERIANKDTVLPIGGGPDGQAPLLLKAGEGIAWSLHSMHRRKDLYGDDAAEFRPERWGEDKKGQGLRTIGWGYLPFHGGPRTCMGQQRALNEGSYILARIAQTFSAIQVSDDIDIEKDRPQFKMTITTTSSNGVWVKLTKAA
ncbi:cytochrome P450 [Terfezia boudieri ATCC MYA-4762]|uniref:Cytochrome P450 n=1 Tax=Terfezia boudieri ATCC MYA-4762 TaxID=1051890 RepID=A0A3N4LG51_9PEZI|nr:cytochrome P450 [Terfezia boudieri ATCC MYA-4762]